MSMMLTPSSTVATGERKKMANKSGGAGKRGRSAVTGKFVKQSTVKKNPKTTVNEATKKKNK